MTIREALAQAAQKLKNANIEAPAADAGVIICHVLGCSRVYLYSHGEEALSDEALNKIKKLTAERVIRKPLQHITGHREFMSLDFLVSPDVLIPRQETETLVEAVISHCNEIRTGEKINILDIGTGSGCISVSLARFVEESRITAVDISYEALEIAHKNSQINKTEGKIDFIKSNLFSALDEQASFVKFDVIVSNPPYIRSGDIPGLEPEVALFEPMAALDGGTDGLDFYRAIVDQVPGHLKQGGLLAFETGYDQSEEVAAMMTCRFDNIRIIKDLSGIGRVVCGIFKQIES